MLTHVVEHMATKEDIAEVRRDILSLHTQVNAIERELRDIKLALTRVLYREDIDAALAHIAAIEQHLGLSRKIAA